MSITRLQSALMKRTICLGIALGATLHLNQSVAAELPPLHIYRQPHRWFVMDIIFSGKATGGDLFVCRVGYDGYCFGVNTDAGESAASVMKRMDKARTPVPAAKLDSSSGIKALTGFGIGEYAVAGTEKGLGIPDPPMFLSGRYDNVKDEIVLHWRNPLEGYSAISWMGIEGMGYSNETRAVLRQAGAVVSKGRLFQRVIGFRGQVMSSAGMLTVSPTSQEELGGLPFYCGVTPNWRPWFTKYVQNDVVLEQGTRPNLNRARDIPTPDGKPFYQIVRTKTTDVQAGIWRKWLGLVPKHKYRVYVRLNTLAMDQNTNDWSLSFHVAVTDTNGTDFTTEQFTGKAPLPDGNQGPEAARIALYGPGKTTKGQWMTNTVDIVMPPGVDTLTTWLRHSGKESTGVGMDWIKVEDLSWKSPTNAPSVETIRTPTGVNGL